MKTYLKIILTFFIHIVFFSCENPNPKFGQLPPITTEGKGTFGYKVDGEVQGQCYDGFFTSLAEAELRGDTTLNIYESCNSNSMGIYIANSTYLSGKTYNLSSNTALLRYMGTDGVWYMSDRNDESGASFTVLKYDNNSKIMAGTFSGLLFNEDGESVEITDGRFDLIYKEY